LTDDFKKMKSHGYKKTLKQLKNWGIEFQKLYMIKPSFDFYVDDKSYNYKKDWMIYVKKKFCKFFT